MNFTLFYFIVLFQRIYHITQAASYSLISM